MGKSIILAIVLIIFISVFAPAQEVVVTGFPLGVGGDVDSSFFEPYYPQLQEIADTLGKYPLARAIIMGGADGGRFYRNNDSNNPGLALGRAQALRDVLVNNFNVDINQIIIQSSNVKTKGELYRYAGVKISKELVGLEDRLVMLEQQPPVEKHITEVKEIQEMPENMGLQLGAGISTSPFGAIPILTGAVTWKKIIFFEGIVGHTFWRDSYTLDGVELKTIRRMAGGQALFYPFSDIPVGAVGGWMRTEELSRKHNDYIKMSEGIIIGLRVTPHKHLSLTAVYNPAKHNTAGDDLSKAKTGQFLAYLTFHILFGGEK